MTTKDYANIARLLESSESTIKLAVQWGEMDALGHVNNVVYFRYLESARVAHILALGLSELRFVPVEVEGRTRQLGFILQEVRARFRRPVFYPDSVRVTSRLVRVESDRFTLEHEVISESQQVVAAVGEGTIVMYDYERKEKAAVPAVVKERLLALRR